MRLLLVNLIFLVTCSCSTLPKKTESGVPPRLTMVTLAVTNLKTMSAFYDKLGWPRSPRSNPNYVAYQTGGAILSLWPQTNFDKSGLKKDSKNFSGIALAINVQSPQQVDEALTLVKAAGGQIVTPARNTSWGGRSGDFKDPEGNLWEITWAEGVGFDDRGAIYF